MGPLVDASEPAWRAVPRAQWFSAFSLGDGMALTLDADGSITSLQPKGSARDWGAPGPSKALLPSKSDSS